jgi:hypothetical protein
MPLSGGATDKFGNRYEGLWTVDCMIDVIEEAIAATQAGKPSPNHLEIDRVAREVFELLQRVYVETESESRLRKTILGL